MMSLSLTALPQVLAVVRLPADAAVPADILSASFVSITRTEDELSIVCPADMATGRVVAGEGWIALRLDGVFDFSEVGIMAAIATTLAEARVSVLPIATHDTDYILVRESQLEQAVGALEGAGHTINRR